MACGLFVAALVAGVAATGCSSGRAPLVNNNVVPPDTLGQDGGGSEEAGAPRCSVPTPEVCDCAELPLAGEPPNVYFVLDHSGSMLSNDLWTTVSTVVLESVRKIGNRANFGATMFPAPASLDACAVGKEILSTRRGDSPGTRGPVWQQLHDATVGVRPNGGTPTAATLDKIRNTLTALPGKTFVVLATDGGPNCNATTACTTDNCIFNIESVEACTPTGPNCCDSPDNRKAGCLDVKASQDAVKLLGDNGIATYVIGVPGSGPYGAFLESLATLGGTARPSSPKYYRVDTADAAAFSKTLSQVVAKIVATCVITLSKPPSDPDKLNVYLDEQLVPQEPDNGWTLEDATVTLKGATCEKVLAGEALDVRVVAGCRTFKTK